MLIICFITEQIKKLCVHDRHHKIECIIGITDNHEHCCLLIPDHIQLHFIIRHDLPKFLDIKRSKSGAAGNKDRLRCFSGSQLIFSILSDCKVFRIIRLQFFKQFINRILKFFIFFSRFTGIDEFQKSRKVLFFFRRFIPNITDQSRIQKAFRFHPEIFRRFFSFPLRICDNGIHKFEDIFFTTDVMEWIVVHRLFEIDRIQHLDPIASIY